MKSWTVYEHISPSGKVYVGITCQKPERRWKGGSGYIRPDNHQPLFANAILKYGWDNILHNIVAEGLTKEEADLMEMTLISKYKREHRSYNITDGGDGGLGIKHTEKTKKRLSEAHKGLKQSKEIIKKKEETRLKNKDSIYLAIKPGKILSFATAKEAAKTLGIKHVCNIFASIAQKQCLVNGYLFIEWEKELPIKEDCIYQWYNFRVNNRYSSERRIKDEL